MRSFDPRPESVVVGERGQLVHRDALNHSRRFERHMYPVRPGVWTLVGNGLSNQTFIDAPEGIIAIDTGESVEEMQSALAELRKFTARPVVAIIYTHFHYVSGSRAVFDEAANDVPVYGHERIVFNRNRAMSEIGPAYSRGLVQQFGTTLPLEGPDGIVSVGLGIFYRNPDHRPFTDGFVAPTVRWHGGESLSIAGTRVEVTHAPSDADDSLTLWFPEFETCVHNIVWPALFNIFAIRGEEYRDPQVLLRGLEHVLSLAPEYLVGTHGPPIIGREDILRRVTAVKNAIQFLWDQTVRGLNKGWTADEISSRVRLPDSCDDDYLTQELYGVAEHHVRQICNGLRGWFDGDPAKLFPLPPAERADRLITGFGGREKVIESVSNARRDEDLRWALELASWMVTSSGATTSDRQLLADVLRDVGYRSAAANIRNWCITTARDLDGSTDLSRLRQHRLRENQVLAMDPRDSLRILRVMIDADLAIGVDHHLGVEFHGYGPLGLHVRNGVAVATDGGGASDHIAMSYGVWAKILSGSMSLSDAMKMGEVSVTGSGSAVAGTLGLFENPGLRS